MHKFLSMYLFIYSSLHGSVVCWLGVYCQPVHDTATNTDWQLPEAVLIQSVSPDDEHDMLETCRELYINTLKGICASSWTITKKKVCYIVLHTAVQAGRSRVRFPMGFIEGHCFNPAGRTMVLGSASNINDCQGNLLGVKGPVPRDDNLTTFMCWLSRNSGSLIFLEPKGPVQACKGTALPSFTSCVIRVLNTTD